MVRARGQTSTNSSGMQRRGVVCLIASETKLASAYHVLAQTRAETLWHPTPSPEQRLGARG